jgi:hypothetical protein
VASGREQFLQPFHQEHPARASAGGYRAGNEILRNSSA